MMREVPRDHTHLWNNLPAEERKRLHPYQIETQILCLEQARAALVRGHNETLSSLDNWITELKNHLKKYPTPSNGKPGDD